MLNFPPIKPTRINPTQISTVIRESIVNVEQHNGLEYFGGLIPESIAQIRKTSKTEIENLSELAKKSKEIMQEYEELFKSKTLEELYTPKYHYTGILPNTTYIIDKKTGKKKLMHISKEIEILSKDKDFHRETYKGKTIWRSLLGDKSFRVRKEPQGSSIQFGKMDSYKNNRYAGTQIRLTQVEVERAMQEGVDTIPLYSMPEALPFHTMMGFRPIPERIEIRCLDDIKYRMQFIDDYSEIRPENLIPIIHEENGKFFFDPNQTLANSVLRQIKQNMQSGKVDFKEPFKANCINMELSGKELEAWKQRALSQPILLK